MSDAVPAPAADSQAAAAPTAGALLRKAREAAGLHVAALAVSMKVPVKKLEALESDRLDLLPDAVFVRALASSVCRTLKIDPVPILGLLPQTTTPRLGAQERSINAPFHASGEARSHTLPDFLRKPVVIVVVLLLVSALGVVLLPESEAPPTQAEAPAELQVPQDPVPAPADTSANASVAPAVALVMPSIPADRAQPMAQAEADKAPAPQVTPPTPLQAASNSPVVSSKPAAAISSPVADGVRSGVLVLRSKGEAWVEVVDAKGVVQIRKTLASGESAMASGPLPLSVVIGRADATEVEVRGKAFSLEKIAKDNVARFEVK